MAAFLRTPSKFLRFRLLLSLSFPAYRSSVPFSVLPDKPAGKAADGWAGRKHSTVKLTVGPFRDEKLPR